MEIPVNFLEQKETFQKIIGTSMLAFERFQPGFNLF